MTLRRTLLKSASSLALAPWLPAQSAGSDQTADWAIAPPDSQGMRSADLSAVLAKAGDISAMLSVVVARHGKLVAENCFNRTQASDLRHINSVTKSVASILVGQAIDQGKIKSLDQTVSALLPASILGAGASAALNVTLRQILTGTTGLAYDVMSQFPALASAADPVGYVMALPKDKAPPGTWSYNDAAVSLLTPILEHVHGMPMADVAKRDLFDPLGIGVSAYAGLQLRTRDIAKVGWLMANGGLWRDRRIVSAAWVEESTHRHVSSTWEVNPIASVGYGYLWFTGTMQNRPVVWGWGYGAQFALFAPSLGLVVATNAISPHPTELRAQNNVAMGLVSRIVALAA